MTIIDYARTHRIVRLSQLQRAARTLPQRDARERFTRALPVDRERRAIATLAGALTLAFLPVVLALAACAG